MKKFVMKAGRLVPCEDAEKLPPPPTEEEREREREERARRIAASFRGA